MTPASLSERPPDVPPVLPHAQSLEMFLAEE